MAGHLRSNGALSERRVHASRRAFLMAFFYILRCVDGTLYVGHTSNLTAREKAHNDGTAAAYTAERRPVRIAYSRSRPTAR